MKPWEKYQQAETTAPAPQAGPWQNYAEDTAPAPEIVNEVADLKGRAIAKNFAQSPDKQVQYLQKMNPDYQVSLVDGEVVARKPGEAKLKKLDADFSPISDPWQTLKDLPADALDIAYDVPAGFAQAGATALGALGGTAVAPGVGTVAGAITASGASSAASEALRQKLGKQLGIDQQVSGKDVATAGLIGAASTGLLGAGKVGGQQVKGLVQKGYEVGKNTVAPKLASALSGVPVDRIKGYANNMDAVDQLEREGVTGYVDKLRGKITDWLDESKQAAGKNVRKAVEGAKVPVDISKAKAAFTNRINQLQSKPNLTEADQAEIDALKASYQKYFGLARPKAPSPEELLNNPQAKIAFGEIDEATKTVTENTPADFSVRNAKSQYSPTYEPSQDSFLGDLTKYTNAGIDEAEAALQSESQQLAQLATQKASATRDAQIKAGLAKIAALRAELTQRHIPNNVSGSQAFDLQQQLKQLAKFDQNMTPATASMKGSARQAYGALNEGLDQATEAASPAAKAEYKRMLDIEDALGNNFDSNQKTYNTVTGIDAKGRKMLAERLKKLSQTDGVDISKESEILGAYESFAKPGMNALSGGGTTSTSRTLPAAAIGSGLGTLVGYKLGGGVGGAVGGLLGAGAGSMIGSPATIKAMIKAGASIEEVAAKTGLSNQAIQKMLAPAASRGLLHLEQE